jgi:ABC-type protease/lipase transport system fused ATPase/permease subunit
MEEILAFLRPDESALQFLARTYVPPVLTALPLIDNHVVIRPGNVVEVVGPSGSGKTEVLHNVRAPEPLLFIRDAPCSCWEE